MVRDKIKQAISNEVLYKNLKSFVENYKIAKEKAYQGHDFENIRRQLNKIKDYSYDEIVSLYEQFKENAEAKGCYVYAAKDGHDANSYILDVCRRHGADLIVKSKSMTSEEIRLNDFLKQNDITPIETDLGEWILQLAEEKPSHMVMPAIHKSRQEVARLFEKIKGRKVDENDIKNMVKIARHTLRDYFFKAKVGITGANFAVAETGTIAIVTNEGNARLTTTIPNVHIVLLGYEKLVKSFSDSLKILRALPKSATGQIISTYVSWISGTYPASDNKEVHFVFLDNGRLPILKNPALKEALKCIRCGSCANVCPVYEIVGGHVFGSTYVGAIGLILTCFYEDEKIANELLKMCIGCKTCSVNCPAGIDLQSLIFDINAAISEKYHVPTYKKIAACNVLPNPYVFSQVSKIGKFLQKPIVKNKEIDKIPFVSKDLNFRVLPAFAHMSFTEIYQKYYNENRRKLYKSRVFFYSGCAIEYFFTDMGLYLLNLLDKIDVKVDIPKKMVCCGLPSLHMGLGSAGLKTILKNLRFFDEDIDQDVLVLCPTCGSTIKHEYPKYTIISPKDYQKSIELRERVKPLSQFLSELGLKITYKHEYKVTYHNPCHQKRGLCFSTEEFLKPILGEYFVPLKDSDKCCGFGGSFSFDFPEISSKILDNKIENIISTKADIVLTDCPGCVLQIQGGLKKRGLFTEVMHLSEFLEKYTELEEIK